MDFAHYRLEERGERDEGREDPSEVFPIESGPSAPMELDVPLSTFADLPIHLNRDLIDSTRSLQEELKALFSRLERMDANRDKVTESVYRRVKSDYATQYRELLGRYRDRKTAIDAELEKLYEASREIKEVLKKHEETLEEAKFRHFLGEYSDSKYKAVEVKEVKFISKYSQAIEKLGSYAAEYESVIEIEDRALSGAVLPEEAPGASKGANAKSAPRDEGEENTHLSDAEGAVEREEKTEDRHPDEVELRYAPPAKAAVSEFTSTSHRNVAAAIETEGSIADILRKKEPLVAQKSTESKKSASSRARLSLIESGGEPVTFSEIFIEGEASIGRLPHNTIVLPSSKVSRNHARIYWNDGGFEIEDLGSSNGLLVNGTRLARASLKSGDIIGIGRYQIRFE